MRASRASDVLPPVFAPDCSYREGSNMPRRALNVRERQRGTQRIIAVKVSDVAISCVLG